MREILGPKAFEVAALKLAHARADLLSYRDSVLDGW
jgi:hypothetical protein